MKANKVRKTGPWALLAGLGLVVVVATVIGIIAGYEKLHAIWVEQCVITDMASQVEISTGKMIHPSIVAEELGLRIGANLALIDFPEKRNQLLAKVPNLRDVRISRRLPDKVIVVTEERVPVARLELKGKGRVTGRVVDTEGMVFVWQRGTQTLPTIREPQPPGTQNGQHITQRTLAALRLIEACREPDFAEFGLLEVDVSKRDFLLATLGNYSTVKIAWEGMDEQTPASLADLVRKLGLLRKAIRSQAAPDAVIWNATMPDTITGDTQRKL